MSTHVHLVTHVSLPKFAAKVDVSVLLRNEKTFFKYSWGKNRAPNSLSPVTLTPNKFPYRNRNRLFPSTTVQLRGPLGPRRLHVMNTASSLPGASPPHRAGLVQAREMPMSPGHPAPVSVKTLIDTKPNSKTQTLYSLNLN